MVLPGNGVVANSQCSITGSGSSINSSGNNVIVTLPITFSSSFAGDKVIYAASQAANTNATGWLALGTWNIPGPAPVGPSVTQMQPARSSTAGQIYTFLFADTNGWPDIGVVNILVNSAIDGVAACYLAVAPTGVTSGTVYLVNDAGAAAGPYATMSLPGSGTVQNSQCSVSGSGSYIAGAGNTLTIALNMSFSPAFAGDRIFYLAARNNTLNSGWQAAGSVLVP